jgi:FkbM family methyltransferase
MENDHATPELPGTKPGELTFTLSGRQVRFAFPESGDMRPSLERVLTGKEYPVPRLPGYEPTVIVDVGANVGASAVFFHAAFPKASIYCFEPSPTNVAYLRGNVGFTDRIRVFPVGLADCDATVKLYVGKHQGMQNSIVRSAETGESFEMAEIRQAGRQLDEAGIGEVSILKVDTEGCELPILQDLTPRLPWIDLLYVEYHSERDRRAIERMLEPHFVLLAANASRAHRGTNAYVSNRMVERFAVFNSRRLDTPPLS